MAKHNYENQNVASFKLPRFYIEIAKDGHNKWYWRLMADNWELMRSKMKFVTEAECKANIERIRDLFKDKGMCPILNIKRLTEETDDDNSM